jgi:hypothetical protein
LNKSIQSVNTVCENEPFSDLFFELKSNCKIIESSETLAYENGLKEYFRELRSEIDILNSEVAASELVFDTSPPPPEASDLIQSDLVMGSVMVSEEVLKKYAKTQHLDRFLRIFSKVCIMKEKHNESVSKLKELLNSTVLERVDDNSFSSLSQLPPINEEGSSG